MTTLSASPVIPGQLALDDLPHAPLDAETQDRVSLIAHDWRSDDDWQRFHAACMSASVNPEQTVDPNKVRRLLTNAHGLTIEPRRLSVFWNRATSRDGFLDNTGEWVVNTDRAGGNHGKPIRQRVLRAPRPDGPMRRGSVSDATSASEPGPERVEQVRAPPPGRGRGHVSVLVAFALVWAAHHIGVLAGHLTR